MGRFPWDKPGKFGGHDKEWVYCGGKIDVIGVLTRRATKKCCSGEQHFEWELNYRAALAFSTMAAKAALSWMAISDRLLRLSSIPAFFTPFMKVE